MYAMATELLAGSCATRKRRIKRPGSGRLQRKVVNHCRRIVDTQLAAMMRWCNLMRIGRAVTASAIVSQTYRRLMCRRSLPDVFFATAKFGSL